MHGSPIDSLTPKERECLRLVAPDRKSAVIAAQVGIAVPTVETHIRSARAKLGGVNRFVASRMLVEHEARQSLTSHTLTIPDRHASIQEPGPSLPITVGSQPLMMSDARPTFDQGFVHDPEGHSRGSRLQVSVLNRMALIAFCLLALVVAGVASIPLSNAVQDVARLVMTQRTD